MDSKNNNSLLIKNDYKPALIDGKPTELQIIREFSYLFDYVLNGYSVPFQLRKFLFKIFTLTTDDKTYAISDYVFAEQLGNVSRNYVVNLRKKLKVWFNSESDEGLRNYAFVSITENQFDTKTKKQKPTEYAFSLDFLNLLGHLQNQLRSHKKYKENWIIALKEVCAIEKTNRLTEFGVWDLRKKKRERSTDSILGTYLLNFKRTAGKIQEFIRLQGFEAEQTKDLLLTVLPGIIEQSYNDLTLKESSLKIKPATGDFETFMRLAFDYVNAKENKAETVFPKFYYGELKNESRNSIRSTTDNIAERNTPGESNVDKVLDNRKTLQPGETEQSETTLDSQRQRFLERFKSRK